MAEKKTLQNDHSYIFQFITAGSLAGGMGWVFTNQFILSSIGGAEPVFKIGSIAMLSIFFAISCGIVLGGYFAIIKKWQYSALSVLTACILVLSIPGEFYNVYSLFYLIRDYPLDFIDRSIVIYGGVYSLLIFFITWVVFQPVKKNEGVHGTAEIQLGDDYVHPKFSVGGGGEIVLGRHKKNNKILSYKGEKHLVTLAPTRSGKGVGSIIPNLLHFPHSVIVVDPKGENCNFTAEHRARHFDQNIICLDPFRESVWGKQKGTNHFNPLDAIPHTFQKAFRPCNAIVDTIFSEEIKGDPFWIRRAKSLYLGFLIYICTAPEFNDSRHPDYSKDMRNLSTVNHLFSLPGEDLMAYIEKISVSDVPLKVKTFANDFLSAGGSEKMLIGIMETLKSEIQLFHSPELSAVMSHSDFSFDEVATGNVTVYLIVPPEELRTYSKWTRIMITMFIQRSIYIRKTRLQKATREKILFIMDEFTNLGKLNIVKDNYSIAGGYGLKFWIIFQDLGQLKPMYPKSWTSFFSNAEVIQVFGVNDIDTADYFSKTIGKTTVVSVSKSKQVGGGFGGGARANKQQQEQGRQLYTPDEIKRFPRDEQFLITNGENPIVAKKIKYYSDPAFRPFTPEQSDVFEILANEPVWFPVAENDISVESKLKLLIHGDFIDSGLDSDSEMDSNQLSIGEVDRDIDIDDDFDISII